MTPTDHMSLREEVARGIYELDPFYEGGEWVDSFQVSPGGNLTWEQAKARDAEFADEKIMLPVTKFAYDAADAALTVLRKRGALSMDAFNEVRAGEKGKP